MVRRLPKYCVEDTDRYGNIRVYFRKAGYPKTRLTGIPWTDEFMEQYKAALEAQRPDCIASDPARGLPQPGTWRWLCVEYFRRCATYLRMDQTTREAYRRILEGTFEEPISTQGNASGLKFAGLPVTRMTTKHVRALRDRKIEAPEAANSRVKTIRSVFKWALDDELASNNPAAAVTYFKSSSTGHHTWTVEEVRKFEETHPIGTNARLAMALMLYAGVRRSDAVRLGRQHLVDGWLRFTAFKNRNRSPVSIELPVLPELQRVIDGSKTGNLTFLITHQHRPYTAKGFSGQFRKWCDDAGLNHCSAHGVRKAGATIAAENGATEKQLMAIFGWSEAKMAAHYTQKAQRRKLASAAMGLIRVEEN